jgi:hypothetical protein
MRSRQFYDDALRKPTLSKAFPSVGHLERSKVKRAAEDVLKIRNRSPVCGMSASGLSGSFQDHGEVTVIVRTTSESPSLNAEARPEFDS